MPNKKKIRKITMPPPIEGYKPFGVPMRELESVVLLFEEFEALRLADYENLTQEEAAEKMQISRPTFTRLYDKALKSIARAFVEGKAIIVRGGTFYSDDYWYKCRSCNETIITRKPVKQCNNCESDEITWLSKGSL